jgi:hypothetical protein
MLRPIPKSKSVFICVYLRFLVPFAFSWPIFGMGTFFCLFLPLPALRAVNLMRLRAFIVIHARTGAAREDFPYCPGERDEFAGIAAAFDTGIATAARPFDYCIKPNLRSPGLTRVSGEDRRNSAERVRNQPRRSATQFATEECYEGDIAGKRG